jgi:PBP1b-binding outer membrane lipoprotein LpoB
LSTRPRTSLLVLALLLAGCSPEQSKNIGDQPKKIVDKATVDVNKAMQQGAERLEEKK